MALPKEVKQWKSTVSPFRSQRFLLNYGSKRRDWFFSLPSGSAIPQQKGRKKDACEHLPLC
jgi:hypothetical protein